MDKQRFLNSGLLEQYVLGITTEEETREVEQYLEAFPDLHDEARQMRGALEEYARQYAVQPPDSLRSKVITSAAEGRFPATGGALGWGRWLGYAAAVVILTSFILLNRKYQQTYREMTGLQKELAACAQKEQIYALLADRQTEKVVVQGGENSSFMQALVLWNPETKKACFTPIDFPPAPAGKQYQVWADVDGEMISVGLLSNNTIAQPQQIRYIDRATSINVTVEPAGGSDHPTVALLVANGPVKS